MQAQLRISPSDPRVNLCVTGSSLEEPIRHDFLAPQGQEAAIAESLLTDLGFFPLNGDRFVWQEEPASSSLHAEVRGQQYSAQYCG